MIYVYILAAVALVVYLGLVVFMWVRRRRKRLDKKALHYIHSHWYRILDSFENDIRGAILDADKLLDYCLAKRIGVRGKGLTLGEKLKKGKWHFSDIDAVWRAHKLRNKIAHELNFNVSLQDARKALSSFKKALRDLGAKL